MWSRRPRIRGAALLAVGVSLLAAAGCGGTSSAGAPSGTSSTIPIQSAALAFARCMRAHGIPGWPDPDGSGHFDKSKLRQLGVGVSRVRALEEGPCTQLNGASQGPTITAADRTDYLKAAACMRSHGFPTFPDPTFGNDTVETNIPSSIDQDAARFRRAAAICTRLIPAGLPYSWAGRS